MSLAVRLFRFALVGSVVTAASYVVFTGLVGLGLHYLAAATAGWACGTGLSFVLNKRFTFAVRRAATWSDGALFLLGYGVQLGLGLVAYAILISGLGLSPTAAFVTNLALTSTVSFAFMQLAVFRSPARAAKAAGCG